MPYVYLLFGAIKGNPRPLLLGAFASLDLAQKAESRKLGIEGMFIVQEVVIGALDVAANWKEFNKSENWQTPPN